MAAPDETEEEATSSTQLASDPALSPTVAADVDPALAPTLGTPTSSSGAPIDPEALTREQPDRYDRGDELGRGGMGRVLVAFDGHLGREVAMKELLVQSEGSTSSGSGITLGVVTRFLREARITGQLEHPNIVPVHELGRRDDGTLYYTMKRVRGRSFATVLKEAQSLTERLELLPRFFDVCEAVAYAHSRGVVHRDIKPDNVMVGEFGETLVVDWGLAKVRGEDDVRGRDIERQVNLMKEAGAASTIDGHAIGTPAYMSPEQARGDLPSIDERSDVWGLGAMLFEILTGRPPYEGSKAISVLQKVLDEPAPKVRDVLAEAPPELAAIADRALLRDPSSRYPDARALAREIEAYQAGRQVHAYEYSAVEQVRRFVGRHRAASVSALVIALAVLGATVLSYRGYRSERDAREVAQTRRDEAIERQHRAEDALGGVQAQLAHALLEHAERSLEEGDPSAAAIFAAGALLHDPASPSSAERVDQGLTDEEAREAEERVARAVSAYLDAEDARRFVFERRVAGATSRGALAPDGRTLVYPAGAELAVEPATGGERRTIEVRADRVLGFLDADRAVIDGPEPMVLDVGAGERLHALEPGAVSFARGDGVFAVGTRGGEVVVFADDDYAERSRFDAGVAEPTVSWMGEELLVAGAGSVALWPAGGGEPLARVELASPIRGLAPSPDDTRLVLALRAPELTILRSPALTLEPPMEAEGPIDDAAWLGRNLVVSAEGPEHLVVRNVSRRQRLDTLHVPASSGHRVESSGRHALIVALPRSDGVRLSRASVFRFERHRSRRTRPMDTSVRDLRMDARRHRLLVATMTTLASLPLTARGLGEATRLAPVPPGVGMPARVAVARDGAVALSTDRAGLLLLEPGADAMRVVDAPREAAPCPLSVVFSADGSLLFASDGHGRIRRYSRSSAAMLTPLEGHDAAACGLSLSVDGDALASASLDGELRIWNAGTGRLERSADRPELRFSDVAFAPGGERVAVADDDGTVRSFRRVDGSEIASIEAHDGWIGRLAWSADGAHLATAGMDGTIRYFTSDDGSLLRIVRVRGRARSLAFGPQGGVLFFDDSGHVVRLDITSRVDARDPRALLRVAQARAGLRLEGLELVPD